MGLPGKITTQLRATLNSFNTLDLNAILQNVRVLMTKITKSDSLYEVEQSQELVVKVVSLVEDHIISRIAPKRKQGRLFAFFAAIQAIMQGFVILRKAQ